MKYIIIYLFNIQCKLNTNHNISYFYSFGRDTRLTLLDNVDCSSSGYLVLLQCSYSTVISSYCNDHDHDAFVVCCKFCTI